MHCEHPLVVIPPVNMAGIYRFLARSMGFPEASWLDDAYWSACIALLDGMGWQDNANELRQFRKQHAPFLESLQVEYTRLFLNAFPHVLAPPYGSVYLSGDAMLYGPSAVLTKQFYRERGFDLSGEADIPDHLTIELEFLAVLAAAGEDADEALFLRRHFWPWFPRFRARVLTEAHHPFYRIMVNLIDFFTREELDNGFESDET